MDYLDDSESSDEGKGSKNLPEEGSYVSRPPQTADQVVAGEDHHSKEKAMNGSIIRVSETQTQGRSQSQSRTDKSEVGRGVAAYEGVDSSTMAKSIESSSATDQGRTVSISCQERQLSKAEKRNGKAVPKRGRKGKSGSTRRQSLQGGKEWSVEEDSDFSVEKIQKCLKVFKRRIAKEKEVVKYSRRYLKKGPISTKSHPLRPAQCPKQRNHPIQIENSELVHQEEKEKEEDELTQEMSKGMQRQQIDREEAYKVADMARKLGVSWKGDNEVFYQHILDQRR